MFTQMLYRVMFERILKKLVANGDFLAIKNENTANVSHEDLSRLVRPGAVKDFITYIKESRLYLLCSAW